MLDPSLAKVLFCGLFFAAALFSADRPAGRAESGRSAVLARNGMVATSQPLAAQAGLRILQQGGNAIDAAVATAAALAVVEPMMTGLGGDVFAMVYTSKGELAGLNASGFSPAAADIDFFQQRNLDRVPVRGAFSVSIPGAVDGWAALLEKYGTMSFAEVLAPAIEYAENGFPVSEIIAADWGSYDNAALFNDKEFARAYYKNGKAPAHGDVFVNKPLAETLRKIAAGGRDAFYKGEIARRTVERLNKLDWPVTMEDMAYQHSDWVEPISTTYRGNKIYELPPNGQGMAALEMLNIIEGDDVRSLGHNSADYLHLLIEAKRLAFADLDAWLADPERARLPVEKIISKEYGREQRKRIDAKRAAGEVKSGIDQRVEFLTRNGDTVYLTVADKDRNVVSFINSIFWQFGSGVVVPDTGILLQNRGALFSLDPGHPNRLAGRKRPYQTIIPAMAFRDNKPWLSFGVMGGDMQPQGHVQVLLNMIEFGMNVQDAGEAARFRHSPVDGVALESGIDATTITDLSRRGHSIGWRPGIFGGYQAIQIDWDRGVLIGGSDPRKDGGVAGW
ncbi:MAG: gamma-glutamyltransferase [Bryobacterales bacterium]